MARLFVYLLVFCALLLGAAGAAHAQRRGRQGQALVAGSSNARYHRAPVYRDYFKPSRRAQYHYGPSRYAYFNRSPYRPRTYRYYRPAAAAAHLDGP
jgi:hypothetical protein